MTERNAICSTQCATPINCTAKMGPLCSLKSYE